MRTIQVSADVFQAIWAARKPGQDDEDAILKELLGVTTAAPAKPNGKPGKSWVDQRSGTAFPDGFEVFRSYLGKQHRARVVNGKWLLNGTLIQARTVNNLSEAIGTKGENGWVNWNYIDASGQTKKITELRDPKCIVKRGSLSLSKELIDSLDINL